MRYFIATLAVAGGLLVSGNASASTLVLAGAQFSVDSDADGVADVLDNAPGVANNQADTDADGIGDAIDPTPTTSDPYLGDPGLGVYSSPPIAPGGSASFDYLLTLGTPPGGWGRIELDFDLDNSPDALFFGPLTASLNTITVPAGLFVAAAWDLYTPGTYTVGMKAIGPGMSSQNWAYPSVTVTAVPEPSSAMLALLGGATLLFGGRRLRKVRRSVLAME
jgi:hypothetical protein